EQIATETRARRTQRRRMAVHRVAAPLWRIRGSGPRSTTPGWTERALSSECRTRGLRKPVAQRRAIGGARHLWFAYFFVGGEISFGTDRLREVKEVILSSRRSGDSQA